MLQLQQFLIGSRARVEAVITYGRTTKGHSLKQRRFSEWARLRPGLFAFTSVRGTSLEGQNQPDLGTYRRIQALRYLLERGEITADDVEYSDKGEIVITADQTKIREVLSSGQAFRVSGCSGCNRPYYNERPGGPLYNYPRPLSEDEVVLALEASDLVTQDG
jgi:biotin synthase